MFSRRPLYLVLSMSLVAVANVPSAAQAEVSAPPSCDRAQPSISDFDGDGVADAIVGSPAATFAGKAEAGVATVVYGTKHGWVPERAENVAPGSTGVPGSVTAKARFGEAVAVAFLDDDECADVIIGAPGTKAGGQKAAGVAYIVFGAPGGLGLGKPGIQIKAGSPGVPGKPFVEDRFGGIITANQGLVDNHLVAFGLPSVDSGGATNGGGVTIVQIGPNGAPLPDSGWTYTQESSGIPDDSATGDRFGQAVAIGDPQVAGSLGTVFVGSPGEDLGDENESGALTVIDGPNLATPHVERWIQGQAPLLGDSAENLDRLGNTVAYGSDPATGQIALVVSSPGEEVGDVHEAGSAFLFDDCTKLADCTVTYLTQGSGPVSDIAEREDRFGTRVTFAPTRTTQTSLFAIFGAPGEMIGTENDAGMVQMIDTQDHSTVYPPIDESLAQIPGEPQEGDRFGDSLTALAYSKKGWLGMIVIGISVENGGEGAVVTVPFAPPGVTGPSTKPRLWDPGVGAIPPVDLSFGTATGGMGGVFS